MSSFVLVREIIVAHFHSRVHVYKYIVSEFNVVFLLAPPAQGTVYDVGRLTATSTAPGVMKYM